jgi:hypothetical protein
VGLERRGQACKIELVSTLAVRYLNHVQCSGVARAVLSAALLATAGACAESSPAGGDPDAAPQPDGPTPTVDAPPGAPDAAPGAPDAQVPTGPATYVFQDGVSPTADYRGTTDTHISENSPTSNFGSSPIVFLDGSDPLLTLKDIHGLIRWDLSAIPRGATVKRVAVAIEVTEAAGGLADYEFKGLRVPWDESATYERASTGRAWQVGGARGATDVFDVQLGLIEATDTGLLEVTFNAAGVVMVQQWVDDPDSNFGFLLLGDNNIDGMEFASSEATTAASRPRLVVETE